MGSGWERVKRLTRKPWAQPLCAGSSVNPVLRSRLPEHIFPLITSPKTSTQGRAGQCERESTSQEQRGEFRLWRCCFKQRCLLQQSKNSQAWKGRRLLWEQQNGKRPFLSLAWRQGVSSLLSGQSREPLRVLPAGSPCLPPAQHQPLAEAGTAPAQKQSYGEGQQPGRGLDEVPGQQLPVPVPPTRWQLRPVELIHNRFTLLPSHPNHWPSSAPAPGMGHASGSALARAHHPPAGPCTQLCWGQRVCSPHSPSSHCPTYPSAPRSRVGASSSGAEPLLSLLFPAAYLEICTVSPLSSHKDTL